MNEKKKKIVDICPYTICSVKTVTCAIITFHSCSTGRVIDAQHMSVERINPESRYHNVKPV